MNKDDLIEQIAIALGDWEIEHGGEPWHMMAQKNQDGYRARAAAVYAVLAPELTAMQQQNDALEELLKTAHEYMAKHKVLLKVGFSGEQ